MGSVSTLAFLGVCVWTFPRPFSVVTFALLKCMQIGYDEVTNFSY